VKNYFVEQNMDLTKESVAFLKTLQVWFAGKHEGRDGRSHRALDFEWRGW